MNHQANERYAYGEHIGNILIKRGLITEGQLNNALSIQKEEKILLGEILTRLGYLEEIDIVIAVIIQCGMPYIAINKYDLEKDVLDMVSAETARKHHVIPLDKVGNVLSVVMSDPLNEEIKKELEEKTECKIATFIATKSEVDEAVKRWYA
ncbi:MAG: hypothetical protein KAR05_06995 [Candidatus Omnitrophica bacterium]|nr:hypothetical protein [Candidatus Omnitrophota bacterium]